MSPTIQELEKQISQGENQLLNRTSPLAFSQILRNALKGRLGVRSEELETSRETNRAELGKARQSLTANLSPDELRNMNPAQQRELVQGKRSGLEASITRSQEESTRIEGSAAEQVELGRLMQEDVQKNMITRLNFLKDDLTAQKDKQAEFKSLAFGLAQTGIAVTPEIDKMLEGLSKDERAIWLSQNTAAIEAVDEQKKQAWAQINKRSGGGGGERDRDTDIIELADGTKQLIDSQTGEVIETYGAEEPIEWTKEGVISAKQGGMNDDDILSLAAESGMQDQVQTWLENYYGGDGTVVGEVKEFGAGLIKPESKIGRFADVVGGTTKNIKSWLGF